jgi:hypothetical protein
MKNSIRSVVVLVAVLCGLGAQPMMAQQFVQITVSLDETIILSQLGLEDSYSSTLVGQSAFITTRTSSGTTGSPLDFVSPPGEFIEYQEIFPEDSLEDYLTFGYFGVLETSDGANQVLNFVSTFLPGAYDGDTTVSFFGFDDAVALAQTFNTSFDSPEFLDTISFFFNSTNTVMGDIALPTLDIPRIGQTLDIVAFIGVSNKAIKIGELSVAVIPEPSTLALVGVIAVGLAMRRNRSRARLEF